MGYDLFHIFEKLGKYPSTLLQVGAGNTTPVLDFLKLGADRIYLFEADPKIASNLRDVYANREEVTVIEGAVSSVHGETARFYLMNHEASSLYSPNMERLLNVLPILESKGQIDVETITLDQILNLEISKWVVEPNKIIFAVFDIQGGELGALKGAGAVLKLLQGILVEVSTTELYEGQPKFEDLVRFLKLNGFKLVSKRIQSTKKHGDALFFRAEGIDMGFRLQMLVEDIHWKIADYKPRSFPSLRNSQLGRLLLKVIYKGPYLP